MKHGAERHARVRRADGMLEIFIENTPSFAEVLDAIRGVPRRRFVKAETRAYWVVPETDHLLLRNALSRFAAEWPDDLPLPAAETVRESRAVSNRVSAGEDGWLHVSFAYDPEKVEAIKTIPASAGRRWDPERKLWLVDPAQFPALLAVFPDFEYTPDAIELAQAARLAVPAPVQRAGRRRVSLGEHGLLHVSFPYDEGVIAALKSLPAVTGANWDRDLKVWRIPAVLLPYLRESLPDFEYDRAAEEAFDVAMARIEAAEALRQEDLVRVLAALGDLDRPFAYGDGERTLYRHQQEGLRFMIECAFSGALRGAINADDMGLGKTCQGAKVAEAFHRALGTHTIVVCPATMKGTWIRELQAISLPGEVHSNAKIPAPPDASYVLLGDEAHAFQSLDSKRTRRFLALAESAVAVYALSGTPMKNGRPANLFPLLKAINHHLAWDRRHYELHFCAAHDNGYGWDTSGAQHLDELHRLTRNATIRRTKSQVLDLPPKTRVLREAEVSVEARALFEEAFAALREAYAQRLRSGEICDGAEALTLMAHARHAASLAKVEHAIELAQEVLDQGQQVVVFVGFREAGERIAGALGVPLLHGGTSSRVDGSGMDPRQRMQDDFQAGRQLAFVSTWAGGEGITLTRAATVILADRPWTPGAAVQAEDRCYRIGQSLPVTCIWVQAFDIDRFVDAIVLEKQDRIDLVLGGKRKTLRGLRSEGDVALAVLNELVARSPRGARRKVKGGPRRGRAA